jgi:hypothetical protein
MITGAFIMSIYNNHQCKKMNIGMYAITGLDVVFLEQALRRIVRMRGEQNDRGQRNYPYLHPDNLSFIALVSEQ